MPHPLPLSPDPNTPLGRFLERLASPCPEPATLQPLLRELEGAGVMELALSLLKRRLGHQPQEKGKGWSAVRARMEGVVARARDKRMAQWQRDPRRRTIRLTYQVRGTATALNQPQLTAALAHTFVAAGLPIAMGMEKTPRPVVHLGHPLPLGAEGLAEWADATLREPPTVPLHALPSLLNHHAADGLHILTCVEIPAYATPVLDLCEVGHWRWPCPAEHLEDAHRHIDAFLASERFEMEKSGKALGQKVVKRLNVRPYLQDVRWEDKHLCFTTRLEAGVALNPLKVLAAVLHLESAMLQGLCRERVDLAADPKLQAAEKYEPKLSNIYEDAVLLESGGNVQVVNDDDDEPLRLG